MNQFKVVKTWTLYSVFMTFTKNSELHKGMIILPRKFCVNVAMDSVSSGPQAYTTQCGLGYFCSAYN